MFVGIHCVVNVDDRKSTATPGRRPGRPLELTRAIEPALDRLIDAGRVIALDGSRDTGQMGDEGLPGEHVPLRMLQGIGIDGQPMKPCVAVVAEFSSDDFIEQALAATVGLTDFSGAAVTAVRAPHTGRPADQAVGGLYTARAVLAVLMI